MKSIYLPLALLLGWLAISYNWSKSSCPCGAPAAAIIPAVIPAPSAKLNITDGSALSLEVPNNLRFAENGFEHKVPVAEEVSKTFAQTAEYLKKNPNRTLKITGLYGAQEKNNGIYPNLGLGRAANVKSMLTALGVPATQILTDASLVPDATFPNGEMVGGAMYSFSGTAVKDDTKLAEIEKRLKAKPMILYFGTNQKDLTLTNEQRKDFSDLQYYLDNKKDSNIKATGHTDNKGNDAANLTLSQNRAEFVRAYLSKNGISDKQVKTQGEGPRVPIAKNDTEENRAKNRRVEITIN
jgi:OmpA-OmpF porin, OOP family